MTEFYQTRMGRTYYDHTLPTIARELERLNTVLERIAATLERAAQSKETTDEETQA